MDLVKIYLNEKDVYTTDFRYISFIDKNSIKYTVMYNYHFNNYTLKKDNEYILKDVSVGNILKYLKKN